MYNEIINKLRSELIVKDDKITKDKINRAIDRLNKKDNINSVLSDLGVYDIDSLNSLNSTVKNVLPQDIPMDNIDVKKEKKKREFTIIKIEKDKDKISIK